MSEHAGADKIAAFSAENAALRLEVSALREWNEALRSRVDLLTERSAQTSNWIKATEPAIKFLFKLAIPTAAGTHKLLQEIENLLMAGGQDVTAIHNIAERISAALKELQSFTIVDPRDAGG